MRTPVRDGETEPAKIERQPVRIFDVQDIDDSTSSTIAIVLATPIDEDGWRLCARVACGTRFKPDLPTRFFCCAQCASIALSIRLSMPAKRVVLDPPFLDAEEEKMVTSYEKGEYRPTKDEKEIKAALTRAAKRHVEAATDPHESKYGPMRMVKSRVSATETSQRVIFHECGHEGVVPLRAHRGRCRPCRAGVPPVVEKKQPVRRTKPPTRARRAARRKKKR